MSFVNKVRARLRGKSEESENNRHMVRVRFPLVDAPHASERVWATEVGSNLYRIENSPFYAYGVSWKDVIEATSEPGDETPIFRRVVKKSGHRTVRIILEESNESFLKLVNQHGCTYEGISATYLSIDIPPQVDFHSFCEFLTQMSIQWEHADPTYADLYSKD